MLYISLILIVIFIIYIKHHYNYWERKKFPYEKPSIPFGSLEPLRKREQSFGLLVYDIYKRSSEKLVGIYLMFRPALLVRDLELVRQILITDFSHFYDRGVSIDEEKDLFSMRGQLWKSLRSKLMPSFSSGKLKGMFSTTDEVGDKLVNHLNGILEGKKSEIIEIKSVLTTYAVDIIGSVIFGLEIDSFTNPNNEFRKVSDQVFNRTKFFEQIMPVASFIYPPLVKFLNWIGIRDAATDSLKALVRHTIKFREENNVVRKDMMQLMIQLRNMGTIDPNDDKNWGYVLAADGLKSLSTDLIAAQAFLFYIAGSETTSASASFTLYELSMYPELLQKAQREVEECLTKHGLTPSGSFTYDALQDMKFLELCIMESTRKYPGLPFLNRECTKDYQVPGTKYVIEKGTPILISLFGLHRDPDYFPDPMKYDPERFLEENHNYNPTAFMPFGEGPRHCIALRMGKLNAKLAVAKILANFNIEPNEHKELEFIFHPAPVLVTKDGLNIRLSRKAV